MLILYTLLYCKLFPKRHCVDQTASLLTRTKCSKHIFLSVTILYSYSHPRRLPVWLGEYRRHRHDELKLWISTAQGLRDITRYTKKANHIINSIDEPLTPMGTLSEYFSIKILLVVGFSKAESNYTFHKNLIQDITETVYSSWDSFGVELLTCILH